MKWKGFGRNGSCPNPGVEWSGVKWSGLSEVKIADLLNV
jgi:hypothetical protein